MGNRLVLWGSTSTTATVAHMVLSEAGADFEVRFLSLRGGEHRRADFLALNPKGEVPVLVEGTTVVTETPVVCQYIAETHPEAGLLPAAPAARAECLSWLAWASWRQAACYAIALMPVRGTRDAGAQASVRACALRRVGRALDQLDARLAAAGDFVMGAGPTLPDYYAAMQTRWAEFLGVHPPPRVADHKARVLARPAVARVMQAEGLA